MKVLVTGGAGYVGSHACKALAQSGHEPIVYDNLCRGHRSLVRWGPLERGDLLDGARLRAVLARYAPDAVMHFAALAYVGESVAAPGLYYRNNVAGTLCLLEAMRASGVDTIVFSSSCATYGLPRHLPIAEDDSQDPISPYGAGKLMAERMLRDYGLSHGLRWISFRYFNAAGADPDGEIGELHEPETHAVPLAILAALGHGPAFRLHGDDYPTADGSAVRDYIHVTDLARAHLLGMLHLANGGASMPMNLGSGKGTSVLELVAAVQRATGRPVPVIRGQRRTGDPPALFADTQRALTVLDWRPCYPDIREIVATALDWHDGAGRFRSPALARKA